MVTDQGSLSAAKRVGPTNRACPAKLFNPSASYLRRYRPSTPAIKPGPSRYMRPAAKPAVASRDHNPVERKRDTSGEYKRLNAVITRLGTSSLSKMMERSPP